MAHGPGSPPEAPTTPPVARVTLSPDMLREAARVQARPDVVAGNARAETARNHYQAGRNREAISTVQAEVIPHTGVDNRRVLINKISSNRDATGAKVAPVAGSREAIMIGQSMPVVDQVRTYLVDGGNPPNLIVNNVMGFLRRSNGIYGQNIRIYEAMGGTAAVDYVRDLLNQPGYRAELAKVYEPLMSSSGSFATEEEAAQAAEKTVRELQNKFEGFVTDAQITAAQTRADDAENNMRGLVPDYAGYQGAQRIIQELSGQIAGDRLIAADPELTRREAENVRNIARTRALLDRVDQPRVPEAVEVLDSTTGAVITPYQPEVPAGPRSGSPQETTLLNRLESLQRDQELIQFRSARDRVANYTAAEGVVNAVSLNPAVRDAVRVYERTNEELSTLRTRRSGQTGEDRRKAESDLVAARESLADARANLDGKKIEYFRKVTHMAEDATRNYLDAEVPKVLNSFMQAESEARRDAIKGQFRERYYQANGKVNRVQVRADFDNLMMNGPENLVWQHLATAGWTADQIVAARNDRAFWEGAQAEVGANILRLHMRRGGALGLPGKISADQIDMFQNTTWGEHIVANAIAGKKLNQDAINAALGENVLRGGKLGEGFKKLSKPKLALLLLLACAALPILAIGKGATAIGAGAKAAGHAAF